MSECLHLTDEEALDSLLRSISLMCDDEVPTLIVAVVGSHFQTQWLMSKVRETIPLIEFNKVQMVLYYKNTRVMFIRNDESLNRLSAIQLYTWLPLCDNIPAKMISWMNYRVGMGHGHYWNQKRAGKY